MDEIYPDTHQMNIPEKKKQSYIILTLSLYTKVHEWKDTYFYILRVHIMIKIWKSAKYSSGNDINNNPVTDAILSLTKLC